MWKRSTVALLRHRQTKGPETARCHLPNRATSRLYSRICRGGSLDAEERRRTLIEREYYTLRHKFMRDWANQEQLECPPFENL